MCNYDKMEYNIDICDTTNMMYKFCDEYNMKGLMDYQEIFKIFFDKYYAIDNNIQKKNISGNYYEIKDLQQNNYIRVQYITYSQICTDFYNDIEGTVIYIDDTKKNGLIYNDINGVRYINSIEKDYCSYYGNTPGYCVFISK